jgi:hypothetical protein
MNDAKLMTFGFVQAAVALNVFIHTSPSALPAALPLGMTAAGAACPSKSRLRIVASTDESMDTTS